MASRASPACLALHARRSVALTDFFSTLPAQPAGSVETYQKTPSSHADHFDVELLFHIMFGRKIAVNVIQGGGVKVPFSTLFAYLRLYVFHKVESVFQPMLALDLFFLVFPPQNSQVMAPPLVHTP